jgi:YD repeat-containing protein
MPPAFDIPANCAASVTQFAYNSLGELTQITDPLGHVSTMTHTTAGLIATITDAQSNCPSGTLTGVGGIAQVGPSRMMQFSARIQF